MPWRAKRSAALEGVRGAPAVKRMTSLLPWTAATRCWPQVPRPTSAAWIIAPVIQRLGALQAGQFERPARHQLVLLQQAAAHAVAGAIAPQERLEAAEAARGARVEGKDRVADDDEAPAQRADRRIERDPVRRARSRRERHDLVAVVLHPRRGAPHAHHHPSTPTEPALDA